MKRNKMRAGNIANNLKAILYAPPALHVCVVLLLIKLSLKDAAIYKLKYYTMKKNQSLYWLLTGAISFFMLFSAYYSGTHAAEFNAMGFPNYFRIELTVAKVIGAFILLFPQVPVRIKEWIYVAFGVVLISACIAKFMNGYPMIGVLEPIIVLGLMITSASYLRRLDQLHHTHEA
ncbi:MAG TPA: DoxX family protein [Ohtaekwangia sp.]